MERKPFSYFQYFNSEFFLNENDSNASIHYKKDVETLCVSEIAFDIFWFIIPGMQTHTYTHTHVLLLNIEALNHRESIGTAVNLGCGPFLCQNSVCLLFAFPTSESQR